ncbi:S-adenosyl-L-methionine-dependent methyltransferase [Serendipita vermifera]|nr:S-adenosyl-L-methionine-dependent methyltransferase [Serendipita vermifera]
MSQPNNRDNLSSDLHRARTDQPSFNLTPSEAATSVHGEDRMSVVGNLKAQEEDVQSRVSVYTYSSELDAQRFLRRIGNRTYNALNDAYYLPTDTDEWNRLDKQHVALVIGLGALYPEKEVVRALLAPEPGVQKKILDLGCGTGVWSFDMAREFPHCDVTGVDLAPVPVDPAELPSNCHFEIDDVNLGLSHFHNQFDVVHARLITAGIANFRQTMHDVEACLKPGGIVIWLDVDYDIYSKDRVTYEPYGTDENPSGSWFQRSAFEMRRGAVSTGRSDLFGAAEALDAGLWTSPLIDPETCKNASLYLPIGPWAKGESAAETQQLKWVGAIMRQDLKSAQRAGHAAMKKSNWPQETLDEWTKRSDEELDNMQPPLWMRMRLAWGRRRANIGEPAPPLPALQAAEPRQNATFAPYPHYYVYDTREESVAEATIRNSTKNLPIPPLP